MRKTLFGAGIVLLLAGLAVIFVLERVMPRPHKYYLFSSRELLNVAIPLLLVGAGLAIAAARFVPKD